MAKNGSLKTEFNLYRLGYAFCIIETPKATSSLKSVKTLYIDDLCVDETARGAHIGTALYQYVTEFAREIGCQRITLNVWCLNESAMRFYEKRGLSPLKITMVHCIIVMDLI